MKPGSGPGRSSAGNPAGNSGSSAASSGGNHARESRNGPADGAALRDLGREILAREEEGIRSLYALLDDPAYARAVNTLLACRGRILVSGVGKSGIVGVRIAASLRSTASPALFLHPVEAVHGDLGLADPADVALLLSRSGESAELLRLLPAFQRQAIPVIGITGRADSALARAADVSLVIAPLREAGPLHVVPSTSVTVFEVLGNLLVASLYTARGVTEEELSLLHPGGVIGRQVLLRVEEVMRCGADLPRVSEDASLRDAVLEIMEKKLGMTTVVDGGGRLAGIVTDGDLRRAVHRHGGIDPLRVREVMTRNPRTIDRRALLAAGVAAMENNRPGPITSLVVVDGDNRPEGVLHLHDCLRLKA